MHGPRGHLGHVNTTQDGKWFSSPSQGDIHIVTHRPDAVLQDVKVPHDACEMCHRVVSRRPRRQRD
jgi:hypothetical protein